MLCKHCLFSITKISLCYRDYFKENLIGRLRLLKLFTKTNRNSRTGCPWLMRKLCFHLLLSQQSLVHTSIIYLFIYSWKESITFWVISLHWQWFSTSLGSRGWVYRLLMNRESLITFVFEFRLLLSSRHKLIRWLSRSTRMARLSVADCFQHIWRGQTESNHCFVCQINIWDVIQPD